MNRCEFREEIYKRLGQNTVELYDEFCSYQDKIWGVLQWFADFCEKERISYQLAYGSLLGVIRDSGQIPWDYDIDVLIPYVERDRLVSLLIEELPSDYYFISKEVDEKYCDTILRIVPKGFHEAFFHLDVFFLVGTASNESESKRHREKIESLFWKRHNKLFNPYIQACGRIKSTIRLWIRKLQAQNTDIVKVENELIGLAEKYPLESSIYVTTVDQWASSIRYPIAVLDTIMFSSEIGTFRIPVCYRQILEQTYGDFTQIPSFEKRVKEFTDHLYLLKRYAKTK